MDRVAVGEGLIEPLEHDHRDRLAGDGAIGLGIERTTETTARENAHALHHMEATLREEQRDAAGDGHVQLAILKRAARQMQGDHGRGGGRVDGDRRAAQVQDIAHAPR